MPKDSVPASISKTAFNCPHCGTYTTQYWFKLFADSLDKNTTPRFPTHEELENAIKKNMSKDKKII